MNTVIVFAVFLGLVTQAAAQCKTTEDENCVAWVKQGFCENADYPITQKQRTCGLSCGLCAFDGKTLAACTADRNENCEYWAKSGFCTSNDYLEATKKYYCCKTCGSAVTRV